jgi:hypothetical protein
MNSKEKITFIGHFMQISRKRDLEIVFKSTFCAQKKEVNKIKKKKFNSEEIATME